MSAPFPLDLPATTAVYLCLYVVTLALHVVFMSYSLGGACYLALAALRKGGTVSPCERTARGVLVDWLPFSLGLTITAGVGPLLFVQILYEKAFYTANLLLFYRWMMIVPVLIVGFYLLYLIKSDYAQARPWLWRGACIGAFLCFAFVAWSWTENHLLSTDPRAWPEMYEQRRIVYASPLLMPRLGMWFFGTWPVMAAAVAWQLRAAESRGQSVPDREFVRLGRVALIGLVFGGACALGYAMRAGGQVTAVLNKSSLWLHVSMLVLGVAAMLVVWIRCLTGKGRRPAIRPLIAGTLASILASGAIRESLRVEQVDMAALMSHHSRALQAGGHVVFGIAFLVNALVIAYALTLAAKAVRGTTKADEIATEES